MITAEALVGDFHHVQSFRIVTILEGEYKGHEFLADPSDFKTGINRGETVQVEFDPQDQFVYPHKDYKKEVKQITVASFVTVPQEVIEGFQKDSPDDDTLKERVLDWADKVWESNGSKPIIHNASPSLETLID